MKNNEQIELSYLKKLIERRFGSSIAYIRDCQYLLDDIVSKTGRQISLSTVKRFWGLIKSPFKPSAFTLDTLACYVGYPDFKEFKLLVSKKDESQEWELIKNKYSTVTSFSLKSIKTTYKDCGINLVLRDIFSDFLNSFCASDKHFSCIVSPSGYGKTEQLVLYVEKLLQHNDENRTVLFIDCCLIENYLNLGSNIEYYLLSLFDHLPGKNDLQVLDKLGSQGKTLLLIFDGFSQAVFKNRDRSAFLKMILKLVAVISDRPGIKIILNLRPQEWLEIYGIVHHSKILSDSIFRPNKQNLQSASFHFPLLNIDEIINVLAGNRLSISVLSSSTKLVSFLKHNLLLKIFISNLGKSNKDPEVELFKNYFYLHILSGSHRIGKNLVLNKFYQLTNWGADAYSVQLIQLLENEPNLEEAYLELVELGLFVETNTSADNLYINTLVQIFSHTIWQFLIVQYWLKFFELSFDIVQKIMTLYNKDWQLRDQLLQILFQFAKYEGNVSFVDDAKRRLGLI
jgi:hypothetical protein